MNTVVVVDDDKDLVDSMKEILKFKGFDVVATGHNGLDAVNLYRKHRPDCVIIDYQMPEYNGMYGLTEIRKISMDIRVVIVSASVDSVLRSRLLDEGANRVLEKPFAINELCEAITHHR